MRVAVLGAGSWGTALAKVLGDKGHHVMLWGRRPELAEGIRTTRRNATFLPDIELPATLTATSSLEEALVGAQMILVAIPTHGLREVLRNAAQHITTHVPVVSATKGIEN